MSFVSARLHTLSAPSAFSLPVMNRQEGVCEFTGEVIRASLLSPRERPPAEPRFHQAARQHRVSRGDPGEEQGCGVQLRGPGKPPSQLPVSVPPPHLCIISILIFSTLHLLI